MRHRRNGCKGSRPRPHGRAARQRQGGTIPARPPSVCEGRRPSRTSSARRTRSQTRRRLGTAASPTPRRHRLRPDAPPAAVELAGDFAGPFIQHLADLSAPWADLRRTVLRMTASISASPRLMRTWKRPSSFCSSPVRSVPAGRCRQAAGGHRSRPPTVRRCPGWQGRAAGSFFRNSCTSSRTTSVSGNSLRLAAGRGEWWRTVRRR